MLAEILQKQKAEIKSYENRRISEHVAQYERMVVLKEELDKLSDGLLKLKIKFAEPTSENIERGYSPCLEVVNIMDCVSIRGSIDELKVSGLGLFNLMGEKHSVESFFKKIARYLR